MYKFFFNNVQIGNYSSIEDMAKSISNTIVLNTTTNYDMSFNKETNELKLNNQVNF